MSYEVKQGIVGLPDAFMCPFPRAIECALFCRQNRFLIQECLVDLPEFMKADSPLCSLVDGADAGECEGERVDCLACWCVGSARGVASDDSLGVHQAALDGGGRPACFDGLVGSLSTVEDDA